MDAQVVFRFHGPTPTSCLRRGQTRRIRELSTLVGLSWLQAPPVPDVRISGRRFDNRKKLTILDRKARAVVSINSQDAESWTKITPDRGSAASFRMD
jgi:hypothetical protein